MEINMDHNIITRLGDVSTDGVAIYDLSINGFSYCNDKLLQLFSIDRETLFRNPDIILKRIVRQDLSYVQSRYQDLLHTGHSGETEFSVSVGLQEPRFLSCQVLFLRENHLVVGFVKDVTRQESHDDFAVDFGARKDTLLDMLTHNLSGPLHLSKDILSSVSEGTLDINNGKAARIFKMLKENTELCLGIVNDFLKNEHHESMRTVVHKTRFDVAEKISVTLDKLREMNPRKTFRFSPDFTLHVYADAIKFFQVMHNILSNAIKFTPDDGVIEILVTAEERSFVVTVKDNGIGIPPEIQKTLFSEQVIGRSGLRGEKSSGLGLSIAKKILDVMGGEIWFESKEERGSVFSFRLSRD